MTTTAPAERQRAFSGSVGFSVGPMTVTLEAVSQLRPNVRAATAFTLACPVDGAAVRQFYRCEDGHGHPDGTPFVESDLARARVVDGERHVVTKEQITEVTSCGIVGSTELSVHPAGQVAALVRPGGAGYRLRPAKKASRQVQEVYAVLLHLAQRSDIALVGELEMPKTGPKLYRLGHYGGQLTLDELVRPDELAPVDPIDAEAPEKLLAMADEFVAGLARDFDPAEYRNTAPDRAAALDERLRNGEVVAAAPENGAAAESDLMAALAASIAGAAKPVTPPRTPRKRAAKKNPAVKKASR